MKPSEIKKEWKTLDYRDIVNFGVDEEVDFSDSRLWFHIGSNRQYADFQSYEYGMSLYFPFGSLYTLEENNETK